ncbi:MAG: class I SAM-dependent methyltransferase [Aquabacterium sp.]
MLKGASATLLLTLAARAAASRLTPEVGFDDPLAQAVAARSPYALAAYAQDEGFVRGVALRSAIMDAMARDFFRRHPQGQVVSLGAGLCSRRHRLQAQGAIATTQTWLHVDLPPAMALRQSLMPPEQGESILTASLLDESAWLPGIAPDRPVLAIAEGVCPYLPEHDLKAWMARLCLAVQPCAVPWEWVLDFVDPALAALPTQVGDMQLPLQSGFASVDELFAGAPSRPITLALHHPFADFSPGHARFEAEMQQRTGRPLYTIAHLAWPGA